VLVAKYKEDFMKSRFIGCCLAVAGLALVPVAASAQSASIGAGFGTQGANIELGYQFNDMWGARLSTNYFRFGHSDTVDDVTYKGNLGLFSIGLLGDLYPWESGIRFTGGVYYNENQAKFHATPTGPVTIGSTTYTPAQVGTLSGRISYRDFAPYAGIGYTSNRNEPGFGFTGDLGVMFQGGPRVELSSTGTANSMPGYATSLAQERDNIRNEADWSEFYPVARVGIVYRF